MSSLAGKTGLIVGVANKRSISWAIARAASAAGARVALTFQGERLEENVRDLAEGLTDPLVLPLDVTDDGQIARVFEEIERAFGGLDFVVHGAAYAEKDDLSNPFVQTTRDGFKLALDVSAYSLTAVVKAAQELLNPAASIVTLTYHGSQQVAQNYNVMGVAKAALEASVRYLANDLGPRDIRVNAISAGPIRTLAASGIAGFRAMHKQFASIAPLRRNVTIEDVGKTALWLCSDWASGVTGETIYVDAGFHNIGVAIPE